MASAIQHSAHAEPSPHNGCNLLDDASGKKEQRNRTKMDSDKREYFLKAAQALAGCQLLEMTLKLYISTAYRLAEKCIAGKMAFATPTEEEIDSWALGPLIQQFRKLNANTVLASELSAFTKDRNKVAHRVIAKCFDPDGNLDQSAVSDHEPLLARAEAEAERLCGAVHWEYSTVLAQLCFDPIED